MKLCQKVKSHKAKNNKTIDLEWLEDHINRCKKCQKVINEVKKELFK